MIEVHYFNLTNGLEALGLLRSSDEAPRFIRIQSTACEQKRWDFLLRDLDYGLLMHLVLGYHCIIHDFSARREMPRSIFQGLEFILYALRRRWLNQYPEAFVRGCRVTEYFEKIYRSFDKRTLKKLDFFRKFLLTDEIHLSGIGSRTSHDGDMEFYRTLLQSSRLTRSTP